MHTVGQKVYVAYSSTWDTRYTIGEVIKVTPSGMVDVMSQGGGSTKRFNQQGSEYGVKFARTTLDTIPFDERTALIAQDQRAKFAAAAINAVRLTAETGGEAKASWGKESLEILVQNLQEKLNAAKAAVEAI